MGGVSHPWDPRCPWCHDAGRKETGRENPPEALDNAPKRGGIIHEEPMYHHQAQRPSDLKRNRDKEQKP